jgi:hypothetical protein
MFSMPGKINHESKAKLNIHLSTGYMIDFKKWVSADQHCVVKVTLGNVVLHYGVIGQQLQIEHEFLDTTDGDYKLQIEVESIADVFDLGHLRAFPMLNIQGIWIENLNLRMAFEQYGKCYYPEHPDITVPPEYIGTVGTMSLQFTTPIYKWLLQCDNREDSDYYSPFLTV